MVLLVLVGIVLGAAYMLWMFQRMVLGPVTLRRVQLAGSESPRDGGRHSDGGWRVCHRPLPELMLDLMQASVTTLVQHFAQVQPLRILGQCSPRHDRQRCLRKEQGMRVVVAVDRSDPTFKLVQAVTRLYTPAELTLVHAIDHGLARYPDRGLLVEERFRKSCVPCWTPVTSSWRKRRNPSRLN